MTVAPDPFLRAVSAGVTSEVERIVGEEAQAAAERVEKRVRGMTAQIAANICQRMSFECRRNDLVITVAFEDLKGAPKP